MSTRKRSSFLLAVLCLMMAGPLMSDDDDNPPAQKSSGLQALGDLLNTDSSKQPSSVAGVRGLEDPGTNPDTKVRDFAAIDRLDLVKIRDEDFKTFISEGSLQ